MSISWWNLILAVAIVGLLFSALILFVAGVAALEHIYYKTRMHRYFANNVSDKTWGRLGAFLILGFIAIMVIGFTWTIYDGLVNP